MDKYITYNSTSEFHKELTNILLLVTDNDVNFYCYCGEEFGTCGLCALAFYLVDPNHENQIENQSPRNFLAKNYNKSEKLELFASKIVVFFDKIKKDNEGTLDFFKREYSWSLRVFSTGETLSVNLDDAVNNEILRGQNDVEDDYGIYS